MSPAHSQALDQALAALRAPGLYLRLREAALPDDILLLLRIAAGEAQSRELACDITGEPVDVVVEAAVLYIQQVMFYPGSDSHRLLGVSRAAPDSQVKEHHRWLARWLHPDRNTEQWDAVYADRVNRAWQDLRTPARRSDYESRLPSAALLADWMPESPATAKAHPARAWPMDDEFALSARTTRRLPLFIMVSLVIAAFAVLGLQYRLNQKEARVEALADEPTPNSTPIESPEPAEQSIELPAMSTRRAPIGEASVLEPPVVPSPVVQSPVAKEPVVEAPVVKAQHVDVPVAVATANARVAQSGTNLPRQKTMPASTAVQTRHVQAPPMVPAIEPVSIPAAPASKPLIDAAIARQVIMRFRSAYSSGNINQFRDLLASSTVDDAAERKMMLRTYSKLFETSASRRIEIHNPDWLTDGDTAVLIATYDAWIVPRGDSEERHYFGNIRFDLRSEAGELRVARLRHDAAGG